MRGACALLGVTRSPRRHILRTAVLRLGAGHSQASFRRCRAGRRDAGNDHCLCGKRSSEPLFRPRPALLVNAPPRSKATSQSWEVAFFVIE